MDLVDSLKWNPIRDFRNRDWSQDESTFNVALLKQTLLYNVLLLLILNKDIIFLLF